jgi:glycosyltransferase involved in cell wall biosynthesis
MISVIIPYWNAAGWIGRCVKSLKSQKGDFEFLFVNDSSTDNSKEIVIQMTAGDQRFIMIDNRFGKGPGSARNQGMAAAEGEWITFLDADDEMIRNAYDTYTAVIAEDPRANIHQLNHFRYYEKLDKTALKYTNEHGTYYLSKLPKQWYGVWNKLLRREFLQGIWYKEGLRFGEDALFILECLEKDNYIHHAAKNVVALKRHFDNKQSLSRIKKLDDWLLYLHTLEEFTMSSENPEIRRTGCLILAENWSSKHMLEEVCRK